MNQQIEDTELSFDAFERLTEKLGYSNVYQFFDDNPGAVEAMLKWLATNYVAADDVEICD